MATCSSRPKIAGQSNRCCIWPLCHVATMAPSSPLPRHLDLLPTLCIAGSPRCIATPNKSSLEKHLPPAKERLLPTVRMREEWLPLYAMQEHLRDAFRKGYDAHRRHRCKLSPDDLARYGSAISGSQGRRPHAGPPQIWYPTPSHRTSSVARAHAGELGHAVLHQEVVTTRVKGVASSVDLEE